MGKFLFEPMSAAGFRWLHRCFKYFRRPKRLMLNCGGKSTLKCALVGRKMFMFRCNWGGIFSGGGFRQICVLVNLGFRTDFTQIVCIDFTRITQEFRTGFLRIYEAFDWAEMYKSHSVSFRNDSCFCVQINE